MLKTAVMFTIFVKAAICFLGFFEEVKKKKKKTFIGNRIFLLLLHMSLLSLLINLKLNASLLDESIHFFQLKKKSCWPQTFEW